MEIEPQRKGIRLTDQYNWREIAELFANRIIERQFLGDFNKKKFIDWFMQREKVGLCFDWRMVARCYTIWQSLQKQSDHFTVICGVEGCLAGDTEITTTRGEGCRRFTIRRLYNHYNGNPDKIIQKNKMFDLSIPSYIRAFNGKDIRLHKLKNVMYSGKKQTFRLVTCDGRMIKATATHKFMTRTGWKPLSDLSIGEEIMCDTLHARNNGARKRIKLYDIQLPVGKNHPYCSSVGRVEVHRLIYEARMNNLEFTEYIDILLNEPVVSKTLKFINPTTHDIHHKDGFHYNNSIDNLELMPKGNHQYIHGDYKNFSQGVPSFMKIESITPLEIEDVYDIECEEPHHNFVANGIVVHNSGKTTLGNQICAWVSPNFSNDDIAFTMKQYLAKLNSISDDYTKDKTDSNDRSVNIDEGGIDLFSREAMKSNNIILAKTFMVQRFLNVNVVICIPYYLGIDKIIRDHRIKTLIIIKARGQYKCIVGRGIKAFNGGLKMNKDTPLNNVPIPYGYFWEGTFRKGFPDTLDRQAYDDYKYKHIKEFLNNAGKEKEETKEQVTKEFNPMEDLPSYRKLTDLARKMGINSKALIKQVKMGELPAIKTGKNGKGNWLVSMDTFKDMLNRGTQQS